MQLGEEAKVEYTDLRNTSNEYNSYVLCIYYDYKYFDDRNENGGRQTIFSLHLSESHEIWNRAQVLDAKPRGSAVLLHSVAAILIRENG